MQISGNGMPPNDVKLGDREFSFLAGLIKRHTGIVLGEGKREMLHARLSKRIRQLGLTNFGDYCALLAQPEGSDELGRALNAITTNLTRFWREAHHFEHLEQVALPALAAKRAGNGRRLRLWSAGCASGEEPYSMAMVLHAAVRDLDRWDARILATDIDTEMIAPARAGVYDVSQAEHLPEALRQRYLASADGSGRRVAVDDALRRLVAFKPLNLLGPWPMKGPFDIIFCRNVVIYFDRETQTRLFGRFADMLADDGFLYIGHSESLFSLSSRYELVGRTIHRKIGRKEGRA